MKVARGRSWQPEIGMEHASRGRRSGNKGVGARWRGRFRIFSARHCSRTKVSHAENSGMTMLFFSWRLLRCRGCVLTTGVVMRRRAASGETARGGFVLGDCFTPLSCGQHMLRQHMSGQRERSAPGFNSCVSDRSCVLSEHDSASKRWTLERPHTAYRRWTGNTRDLIFRHATPPRPRPGQT